MSRLAQVLDYLNNPLKYQHADTNMSVDPKTGLLRHCNVRPLTDVVPLKFLDYGYFSDAYLDTTDNTVIKIVRGHPDHAYQKFVEAARANPMPALPVFHDVIPLRGGRQTVYHMEYLPIKRPDHAEWCQEVTHCISCGATFTRCPNVQAALDYLGTMNLNDTAHRNFGWRGDQLVFLDPTSKWFELGRPYVLPEFSFPIHKDIRALTGPNPFKAVWNKKFLVDHFKRMIFREGEGMVLEGGIVRVDHNLHEAAVENKELRFRHGKPIRPHDHIIGRELRHARKIR
jgi:hypothetical protein